jgi:hypothetical protein
MPRHGSQKAKANESAELGLGSEPVSRETIFLMNVTNLITHFTRWRSSKLPANGQRNHDMKYRRDSEQDHKSRQSHGRHRERSSKFNSAEFQLSEKSLPMLIGEKVILVCQR